MAYTPYLNPPTVSLSTVTASTWTELSSGVPGGASGVKLLFLGGTVDGVFVREVRKHGSTDNFVSDARSSQSAGTPLAHEFNIGVDSGGNFDFYSNSTTPTAGTLYVLGYFGSETTFFTNMISLGAITNAYATYGTGGNCPSGVAAFFQIHGGGDAQAYLRQNGSTDSFTNGNDSSGSRHWLVGLDGSQQISAKIGTAAGRTLYLSGYMTGGITWHTNAVAVTPSTGGSFQNVAQASGDTGTIVANQYYAFSSTASTTQEVAGQTASTLPGLSYRSTVLDGGQCSAYAPSQANITTVANVVLYELGYFTGGDDLMGQAWI